MTIPFGRRRLVLTVVAAPRHPHGPVAPELPAAVGATDAELARLVAHDAADIDRARWQAMTMMYGPHLP